MEMFPITERTLACADPLDPLFAYNKVQLYYHWDGERPQAKGALPAVLRAASSVVVAA